MLYGLLLYDGFRQAVSQFAVRNLQKHMLTSLL